VNGAAPTLRAAVLAETDGIPRLTWFGDLLAYLREIDLPRLECVEDPDAVETALLQSEWMLADLRAAVREGAQG
jgi:hypothetical protein